MNPSARQQKAVRSRLRDARGKVEERLRPAELREGAEQERGDGAPRFESELELRDFVEMQILESMRTGQFDNLKNKGRPLPPHPPASALEYAMRIMRQNGIRPHWLQLMHDIDDEKRLVRAQLQDAWHRHMPQCPSRWDLAVRVAELRIVQVNRSVDRFNLIRPACVGHLFRLRLRIAEELKRAQESPVPEALMRKRKERAGLLGEREEAEAEAEPNQKAKQRNPAEEPRPSWQLFARFVRATEVREYERPTWGRRREALPDDPPAEQKRSV